MQTASLSNLAPAMTKTRAMLDWYICRWTSTLLLLCEVVLRSQTSLLILQRIADHQKKPESANLDVFYAAPRNLLASKFFHHIK
jgi:hypothetical protein